MGPRVRLGDALFSGVQQRVLAVLFGRPDQSFYRNELMRLTGSGKGALQRELDRLEQSGLITVRPVGNQKHYQANRAAPIFEELRGIVTKTFGVADLLREALAPLATRIRTAFIYGSVAKGEDTASSDIDLMVIGDNVAYADLFNVVSEAERRLGRKVNPTVYAAAEWPKKLAAKHEFVSRVMSQPKVYIIGSDDDFRESGKARRRKAAQG